MARVRNKRTGAITEVSDAQLGEIVAAGESDIATDARVPIVDRDGNIATVPQQHLGAMLESGTARLASSAEVNEAQRQAEYGTVGQQALTAGEGLARGVTIGLSDVAAEALGADTEAMRNRRDVNPILAGGTEVVGAVAPLFFSGGTSATVQGAGLAGRAGLAARAGQAVRAAGVAPRAIAGAGEAVTAATRAALGEGALARAAATGAGGAVEGALYGVGQSLSGAALGDHELTAERLFADAGSGALFGGVAGGALSLAGSGVARVAESAQSVFGSALNRATADRIGGVARDAAFDAAARGTKKKSFREQAERFMRDADGAKLTPDEAIEAVGEVALRRGIVSAENRTATKINAAAKAERAKAGAALEEVLTGADDLGARVNVNAVMDRIERDVIAKIESVRGATSRRLAKRVRSEFEGIRELSPDGMMTSRDLQQWHVNLKQQVDQLKDEGKRGASKALQKARAIVDDEIGNAVESAVPGGKKAYKKAKQEYSAIEILDDASADTIKTDSANRRFSLTDYTGMGATVAAMGVTPAGLAMALVAGTVNKVFREQGSGFGAGMLYQATKRVNTVERAQNNAITRALDIARGTAQKARTVAPIVAAAGGGSVSDAFERRAARVAELSSSQAKMLELSSRIAGAAPSAGMQAAMGAHVGRAVNYLQSKLPTRLQSTDPLGRLRKRQKVSTHDALAFTRAANAVENPRSVLKAIGNGTVTRGEMEALRAVYPKMHAEIVAGVVKGLTDLKEAPTLDSLTHLSIVIGQPLHPSLRPENIAAAQALYANGSQNGGIGQPIVTRGNASVGSATTRGSLSKSESIESGGIV